MQGARPATEEAEQEIGVEVYLKFPILTMVDVTHTVT
jgi:hypothetical protein